MDADEVPDEPGFSLLADLDYFALCDHPDDALPESARDRLRHALDLSFESVTLRDIIVEVQLLYSDIRPGADGTFRIFLIDELWCGTEEEAFAIVATYLFPDWELIRTPCNGAPAPIDHAAIQDDLRFLREVSELEEPNWMDKSLENPSLHAHPLVAAFGEIVTCLHRGDSALSRSHRLIWVRRLLRDLGALHDVVSINKRVASRLCNKSNPVDCESLKYEWFVMAAYKNQGAKVISTDDDEGKSGECSVAWEGSVPVHVECKLSTRKIIRPREAQAAFDQFREGIFALMDRLGRFATVIVSSDYDPTEKDAPRIAGHLEQLLTLPESEKRFVRLSSRLSIEVLPRPIAELSPGQFVLTTPRGFDFATSEGQVQVVEGNIGNAKSVAWRTKLRWGWIKSALSKLKTAKDKFTRAEPSIVYLQVPEGDLHVVWLRMRVLAEEIRKLLRHSHDHDKISAVVITGEGQWMKSYENTREESAVVSSFYEVVENARTRNPLPNDFKVFGRDFTAK